MHFPKIVTSKVLIKARIIGNRLLPTSKTFPKTILFIVLIFSTCIVNASVPAPPTFGNPSPVTIFINGSYYLNPSSTNGTFSSLNPTISTINSSGYVTSVSLGTITVSLLTGGGTVFATITVVSSSGLSIADPLAIFNFK